TFDDALAGGVVGDPSLRHAPPKPSAAAPIINPRKPRRVAHRDERAAPTDVTIARTLTGRGGFGKPPPRVRGPLADARPRGVAAIARDVTLASHEAHTVRTLALWLVTWLAFSEAARGCSD